MGQFLFEESEHVDAMSDKNTANPLKKFCETDRLRVYLQLISFLFNIYET
jgi:hypothetical protein